MSDFEDNTIVPSYLGTTLRGFSSTGNSSFLERTGLLYGEVKRVVYPSGDRKVVEYEVEVLERHGDGPPVTNLYRKVVALNLFGSKSDYGSVTYRPDTSPDSDKKGMGNGSKVLLMCINGDQSKAVIIGGVDEVGTSHSREDGHNLRFEFNGARVTVNDEGEILILHRGPTNADGSVKEQYQEPSGTLIRFDKQGSLIVSGPGGEQYFKINHRDGQVELQSDKKLLITSHGQTEITSTGNTFIESKDEAITLTANRGVFTGAATDETMLGTTYRTAENAANQTVAKSLQTAGSALATASAALMAGGPLNAIPMIGGVLAMPFFITAGIQFATAGAALTAAGVAIDGFEAGASTYLSKKNWSD